MKTQTQNIISITHRITRMRTVKKKKIYIIMYFENERIFFFSFSTKINVRNLLDCVWCNYYIGLQIKRRVARSVTVKITYPPTVFDLVNCSGNEAYTPTYSC